MGFAFTPNRDAGVVRRHVCPDTKRRDPYGHSCRTWKEGVRKANKKQRIHVIYEEEVS